MRSKDDGGRAFPNVGDNTDKWPYYDGMSLRQWYAGLAMQGLLSNAQSQREARSVGGSNKGISEEDVIAHWAYAQADAMIAESEK